MSCRILSSRFKITTSWVLVASRMYLRALAMELREGLQIGAFQINRGRGQIRRNLVGEQGGARQGVHFPALAVGSRFGNDLERLGFGQRVRPDGVRLGVENVGFPGMDGRHHLFIIRRDFHRRMNVLQPDKNDVRAHFVAVRLGLDAFAQSVAPLPARPRDMTSPKSTLTR